MSQHKLHYFPLYGRAEAIRMLFALADVPYEEVTMKLDEWWQGKHPEYPFQQLPVLEVNGKMIPQTIAILRYLADQHGFGGSSPTEKAWVNAVALQNSDLTSGYCPWHMVNCGYSTGDKEALYEAYKPVRAKDFSIFEKLLKKSSSGWFVGDSITFADLLVATNMKLLQTLDPEHNEIFEGFPELKKHMEKVHSHPQLQKYMQSRPDYKY